MIYHYDLFAGIGGFSLALEEVFYDEPIKHIFCEWEPFPTAVLRQHWPDGEFWGDIADLVAHTKNERLEGKHPKGNTPTSGRDAKHDFCIVTGGFPCQPFSAAGRRRGTADDRYQWPNMFAIVQNVKPDWVIAENVRGLVTWNEGMVLEQVCTDLESEGYEAQPLIIPAVAVNAPHRRDRVWIIANLRSEELGGLPQQPRQTGSEDRKSSGLTTNPRPQRRQPGSGESIRPESKEPVRKNHQYPDWERNWQEVAFATCDDSVDDGLSRIVDGVPNSRAKWRRESLKAYGNAIVPQVAIEIFKGIRKVKGE